ncbi:MAG: FAD-binding oxidoreductase [Caldilineaceae bacterium]|nr:FAD-binding oxidoreductase [Caldilineaceae bacterium]
MQLKPLWTEDVLPPTNLLKTQPNQVDVAIIGSGYTGLHAAHTLSSAGTNVAVFESHTVGWGASSRNGGMVNPGLKLSAPDLFHHYGPEKGRCLFAWSLAAIDFVERFIQTEAIECNFTRHGQLVLAYKPTHFTALRHEVAWHERELGDTVPQVVGPAELSSEIGSPAYYGGIRDPRAAGLHPAKYVYGLARAASQAGAQIVEQAPVQSLRRVGDSYQLVTPNGPVTANAVLLATNGYTNNLIPPARRGIFSGGSYIITTEPLSPSLQHSVSPRGRMFYDSKHFLNYFRLTPDGRMLFGGRHNLSTDLPLDQSAKELGKRMLEVFPQLAGVPISHSWSGKLGLTFDLMPHAGRIQDGPAPGIFYAYGYGGHGVAVASYLGHMMGNLIAGKPVNNPILDLPHARHFFTPYEKLYLPLISTWFRFLDRIS